MNIFDNNEMFDFGDLFLPEIGYKTLLLPKHSQITVKFSWRQKSALMLQKPFTIYFFCEEFTESYIALFLNKKYSCSLKFHIIWSFRAETFTGKQKSIKTCKKDGGVQLVPQKQKKYALCALDRSNSSCFSIFWWFLLNILF